MSIRGNQAYNKKYYTVALYGRIKFSIYNYVKYYADLKASNRYNFYLY